MLQTNPKQFWKAINPSPATPIRLYNDQNVELSDSETAAVLNVAFSSVFTKEASMSTPISSDLVINEQMPPIIFTAQGIMNIIDKMKLSSATGPDGINSKMLKNSKEPISAMLALLFSQSLTSSCIPIKWKLGKIVPTFKSGNRSSPLNYRPISITSVPSKILEHIIFSHIINHLERHNILSTSQHGFRKGLSCETQLASFTHDLHLNLDRNIQTDVIFLDFEKAFDKVPHRRLMYKLSLLNLDPFALNWIENFLLERKQFVEINSAQSTTAPVLSGVPQGTVLGPLLFLIYVNDLPSDISNNIRLFADDCVLYSKITCKQDQINLQSDLFRIENWCKTWQMSLNVPKCKLMSFSRRACPLFHNYTLKGSSLQSTKEYKYLGVHITNNLSWTVHVYKVIASASRSLGYLQRTMKFAPSDLKLLAYKTLIRPKLEYAAAIWDPHQRYLIDNIEAIQNRAIRFAFSDFSSYTSVTNLKSRASLPPLNNRRKLARLALFHRFHYSLSPNSYVTPKSHVYTRTKNEHQVSYPRPRTNTFAQSFFVRSAKDWNNLPAHVVQTKDLDQFKSLLTAPGIV